jgi:dihydrofolate reductase
MGRIVVFNNLSLDGQFADAQGGLDWTRRDAQELNEYVQRQRGPAASYLFGRVTYQLFAAFWPTPAGPAASPHFAKLLNEGRKVVFSRTLRQADWAGTRVEPEADRATLEAIKAAGPGDALLFGSGSLVRHLAGLGLIDEYQLVLHPMALGAGRPLFSPLAQPLGLALVEAKAFKNGTLLLRYQPA